MLFQQFSRWIGIGGLLDNIYEYQTHYGKMSVADAAKAYADDATVAALIAAVEAQWAAYQANPVGYFDSIELMQLDTMIGGKGINDPALVKLLAENSAEGVEWLRQFDIDLVNTGAFGGASVNRIHWPKVDGKKTSVGAYMIPLLEDACETNENITILFETTANEIIMVDGAAKGIKATGKTGNTVTVNADAVVIAAGGFGANLDMVASYKPELKGFMTTNAAGLQGQGIAMAEAIGAATVDMEQIQIHPTVQFETAALITEGLRGDGAILVNAEGKRFIDEVGTRDVVSAAEIAQTGSYSWLIVDQAMLDASATIAGYVKKGLTKTGATYEELAAATGMPADAFAATMNAWNGYVAAKNDPDFGRVSFANPLDTAPYYAIKVTAGVHHTMGGINIEDKENGADLQGRVYQDYMVKLEGADKPLVLSEFGGYSYKPEGHVFNVEKTYGYGKFTDPEAYANAVEELYREQVLPCVREGLCAAVYTQVSDVEDECNGFLTYDRKVNKANAQQMQEIAEILKKAIE